MKNLDVLRSEISSYLNKVDGNKFADEKEFENDLLSKLREAKFDVECQLHTQPLNEVKQKEFSEKGTKIPDIVIRVEEGFIPLELKFNNTPENYKIDERKLNTYYEKFVDVPKAWSLFLSNIEHKDYYADKWIDTPSNKDFHYLWRKQRALASKNNATLKLADVWNERKNSK